MPEGSQLPVLGGGAKRQKTGGRQKGTPNKDRSKTAKAQADLGKYIEARFSSTPGQQLIDLVMITPKEHRQAKQWCRASRESGGLDTDPNFFGKTELAWAFKIWKTAQLNVMSAKDAAAYLTRMKEDLLSLIHPKQAALEAPETDDDWAKLAAVPVDPDMLAQMEGQGKQQLDLGLDDDVAQRPSHIE